MDAERVVERFRMAAFGMDDWTGAMAEAARAMNCNVVHLAGLSHPGTFAFNLYCGVTDAMVAQYFREGGPDPAKNPRTRAVLEAPPLQCRTDRDMGVDVDHTRLPIYDRLFRPFDVDHAAVVRLDIPHIPGGLVFMRRRAGGAMRDVECRFATAIAPAISDIVTNALRLGSAQDGVMLDTVDALDRAVILLGEGGHVVGLSAEGERLLGAGGPFRQRDGRVVARDSRDDATLRRVLAELCDPVRSLRGRRTMVLHGQGGGIAKIDATALPRRGSGPLSRARVMLAAVAEPVSRFAGHLVDAHDLTPAEAAVACLLIDGLDPARIAERRGTSIGTVRSQLKAMFAKTGTKRQAELVARLIGHG